MAEAVNDVKIPAIRTPANKMEMLAIVAFDYLEHAAKTLCAIAERLVLLTRSAEKPVLVVLILARATLAGISSILITPARFCLKPVEAAPRINVYVVHKIVCPRRMAALVLPAKIRAPTILADHRRTFVCQSQESSVDSTHVNARTTKAASRRTVSKPVALFQKPLAMLETLA